MMKNMIVLLVLTLVAGVKGLDCDPGKVHNSLKEDSNCPSDETSCAPSCCKVGPTCLDLFLSGGAQCSDNHISDMSLFENKATDFATECCKSEADAHTCMEVREAGTACASGTHFPETEDNVKKSATAANFATTCCVADTCDDLKSNTCSSGKHYDAAKANVEASVINFQSKCCTIDNTCGEFACPAGLLDAPLMANINCTTDNGNFVCVDEDCCELDTTLCSSQEGSCGYGKYVPKAKFGEAIGDTDCCVEPDTCGTMDFLSGACDSVSFNIGDTTPATSDTFVAKCCKAKATCADFFATSETLRTMPTFVVAAASGIMAVLL